MANPEFKLAIQGNLSTFLAQEVDAGERASTEGMRRTIEDGKIFARQQVLAAGMGQRLANTWRGAVYPQRGASLRAAGLLFSRAPVLVDAFDRGATIVSNRGFWLTIPTQWAPKNVTFTDPVSGGLKRNKRVTPRGLEQALGIKLRFVFVRNGTSYLAADNLRISKKRGTVKRASDRAIAKGQGKSLPLFWLVKTVTLPKKLDIDAIAAKMEGALESNFLSFWEQLAPNG